MSEIIEVARDGASCSIFVDGPSWGGLRTAAIGRFRCASAASGRAALDAAIAHLASAGVEAVIGPMDGDTWHAYRLVAESDGSPAFFMEPAGGADDKAAFEGAGFAPVSSYVSSRARLDEAIGDGAPVKAEQVTISAWDGSNPAEFVRRLYALSAAAFERNAFFKPLDLDGFIELYDPIIAAVDPRFVLFAHDANRELVGFLFGVPDRLEGPTARTVILKTYVSRRRGVGHLLADRFHRDARDAGFADVIHALMHVDNASLDRSARHAGKIFRRYELMARRLIGGAG